MRAGWDLTRVSYAIFGYTRWEKNTICELRDPEEGPIQRSGCGEDKTRDRFDFFSQVPSPRFQGKEKSKDVPGKREMTEYFRF